MVFDTERLLDDLRPSRQNTVEDDERESEQLLFVGTCQSCGAYWDVRHRTVCTCGGHVG